MNHGFTLISIYHRITSEGFTSNKAKEILIDSLEQALDFQVLLATNNGKKLDHVRSEQGIMEDSEIKRWIIISGQKATVLIGTEFLAHTYVLRNTDWVNGNIPVLAESNLEIKPGIMQINLERWFSRLTGKKVKFEY